MMQFFDQLNLKHLNVREFDFHGTPMKLRLPLYGELRQMEELKKNPGPEWIALATRGREGEVISEEELKAAAGGMIWLVQSWNLLLNEQNQTFQELHGRPLTFQDLENSYPHPIVLEMSVKITQVCSADYEEKRKNS